MLKITINDIERTGYINFKGLKEECHIDRDLKEYFRKRKFLINKYPHSKDSAKLEAEFIKSTQINIFGEKLPENIYDESGVNIIITDNYNMKAKGYGQFTDDFELIIPMGLTQIEE